MRLQIVRYNHDSRQVVATCPTIEAATLVQAALYNLNDDADYYIETEEACQHD